MCIRDRDHLDAAKQLAASLKDGKVELAIKVGEGGRTFGSVSSKEIAAAVKEQMGLDVDKKKIQLKETIKTLGIHNVPIKLHPEAVSYTHLDVYKRQVSGIGVSMRTDGDDVRCPKLHCGRPSRNRRQGCLETGYGL